MMQQEYEFDEVLRRALRVAADSIEPGGDGLERIRARLSMPRPLAIAWLMTGYAEAVMRLRSALEGGLAWFRAVPGSGRPGDGRFGHRYHQVRRALSALAPGHLAQRYGWLRTVAIAAAVVVAGAGGYGLTQLRSAVSDTSGVVILRLPGGGSHTKGGSPDSNGGKPIGGPSGSASAGSGHHHAQPSSSASCSPGTPQPSPAPSPTAAPSGTPTPTPSGTPTTSPTGTPTTSPTATPTTSGGTATGGSPVASPNGIAYLGPASLAGSPSPTPKPSSSSKPCGSVHGPIAPGQRTMPNSAKHQAAQTQS
jgi:hypothetical protein